ncbi:MAG: flavin reductase family protein [Thermoprotei archaeon]|nr:flavin reductase family protein [Thermoprotei archaeon]
MSLRDLDRVLYPTIPVAVVAGYKGKVGAMLAAWWTQLSSDPPLIGVAIAPERYTYKLILRSRVYSINFLDAAHLDKTPYLGDASERFYPSKLAKSGLTISKGGVLGAPIIAEASAALETRLSNVVETGDHDMIVGEVASIYAIENFEGVWRLEKYKPLMYLGRTRRPAPVKRIYVVCRNFDVKELEYAPGDIKESAMKRSKVMETVEELLKKTPRSEWKQLKLQLEKLMGESSLEADDVEYYIDDARRRITK